MLHIYLSNSLDDHRIGAAGARVPGYEIRLEIPDGKPAAPGEEGVMSVRGHSSAPLYWNRPDKTRETMRGDWLYIGIASELAGLLSASIAKRTYRL